MDNIKNTENSKKEKLARSAALYVEGFQRRQAEFTAKLQELILTRTSGEAVLSEEDKTALIIARSTLTEEMRKEDEKDFRESLINE